MNINRWFNIIGLLDQDFDVDEAILVRAKRYVDNHIYRADVVNPLPPDAPAGYLMVTPGDINLYIGTGAGNPLRKIPTQPL